MNITRRYAKKPLELVELESNKALVYNLKKVVKFDTGSHKNRIGIKTSLISNNITHDDGTVEWAIKYFSKRTNNMRKAQEPRLNVISKRLGP